uniref:(California timema) hypothetical protein n=1 Tax=Timema californicum TaxID=61474 RepID=A0A7R9P6T6_TIMCA|nr:unnamed protein product [Timema californicum]
MTLRQRLAKKTVSRIGGERLFIDEETESLFQKITKFVSEYVKNADENNDVCDVTSYSEKELYLYYSDIRSLTSLHKLYKSLTKLVVIGQPLTSLSGVEKLNHLKELWVVECHIQETHFQPPTPRPQPALEQYLACGRLLLAKLVPTSVGRGVSCGQHDKPFSRRSQFSIPQPNQVSAILISCLIIRQDTSSIESCSKMEKLYLYSNRIKRIPKLDTMTNLNALWLSGNKIKHIENLDCNQELQELYLSNNSISELSPALQRNRKLTVLNISGNPLYRLRTDEDRKIGARSRSRALRVVFPNSPSMRIWDIVHLSQCPSLTELQLSDQLYGHCLSDPTMQLPILCRVPSPATTSARFLHH